MASKLYYNNKTSLLPNCSSFNRKITRIRHTMTGNINHLPTSMTFATSMEKSFDGAPNATEEKVNGPQPMTPKPILIIFVRIKPVLPMVPLTTAKDSGKAISFVEVKPW
jgi:hypothetical protein